jgi:O-antigen ligase/tetratricopeptide (TPR) repeat protein
MLEFLVSLTAISYAFITYGKSEPFYEVPGILPLFLLLLFMWGQLIPLPPSLVSFISPGIYQSYAPILDVQDSPGWIPLTVNQKSTLLEALRLSSYALFYIITVQLLSRQELLRKTVKIVAGLATAIAFLAILQKFTSNDLIYWFRSAPSNASPVGPWVYRNHYAGFMELLFPLVLTLFFYYRPKVSQQGSIRRKVVSIISAPTSNGYFFLGFSVVVILASIFIGLSRGGIISATLALFFFLVLLNKKSSHSGRILPLIFLAAFLLAVTWFGWDPILERFNGTTNESGTITEGRLQVWADCIPFIKDFFFTGSGFGTFINTFPQYSTLPTFSVYDHAHNDYIELLTDGGILGFILAASFVITIFRNGFRQLKIRREPYSTLLTIGGLTALFALMIHSITDFNMHNGANGLYFFFICGVLISAGNTRIHFRKRATLLSTDNPGWKLCYLTALPLLVLSVVVQSGIIRATQLYKEASSIYLNPQLSQQLLDEQLLTMNRAIAADPLEGAYSAYKANILSYRKDHTAALENYLAAARKDPMEGSSLQRIALYLPSTKQELAKYLMDEGYKRGQNKELLAYVLAEWYLNNGERQKAVTILQQGSEQFQDIADRLPPFLLFYKFDTDEIAQILPDKPEPWIRLGKFFEKSGNQEKSEYYRSEALQFLNPNDTIKPWYFSQLYWFYRKQKRTTDAVRVLNMGIKWLPDHAPFHIYLGDYYKQQKIPYRAREEYEQALMLEPGNDKIRRRLEKLK